jgi:hypothetical protein
MDIAVASAWLHEMQDKAQKSHPARLFLYR